MFSFMFPFCSFWFLSVAPDGLEEGGGGGARVLHLLSSARVGPPRLT